MGNTKSSDQTANAVSHITAINYPAPVNTGSKIFQFPINSVSDCFIIYTYRDFASDAPDITLTDPKGVRLPTAQDNDLYEEKIIPGDWMRGKLTTDLSIPIREGQTASVSGQWTCTMRNYNKSSPPKIMVSERIILPNIGFHFVLPLKLVLYSSAKNRTQRAKWIKDAMATVESIYNTASIQIQWNDIVVLDAPAEPIRDNFYDTETVKLVAAQASTDTISVLFIDDLLVSIRGEGGKAGGIPGPQGFINNFSAVLIKLSKDPRDPYVVNPNWMAYAIAHEVGHYLGLTHESAAGDVKNLMYPRMNGHSRGILNDKQKYILQHMPIVQMHGAEQGATPIKKVRVVIKTGTVWPETNDGPGTDLNVLFTLGDPDNNKVESWYLDNWGNNFEAGATDKFNLTVHNLHHQDLKSWSITMKMSLALWRIITFAPDDKWAFAHIEIYVDDSLIFDQDINKIMGLRKGENFVSFPL